MIYGFCSVFFILIFPFILLFIVKQPQHQHKFLVFDEPESTHLSHFFYLQYLSHFYFLFFFSGLSVSFRPSCVSQVSFILETLLSWSSCSLLFVNLPVCVSVVCPFFPGLHGTAHFQGPASCQMAFHMYRLTPHVFTICLQMHLKFLSKRSTSFVHDVLD